MHDILSFPFNRNIHAKVKKVRVRNRMEINIRFNLRGLAWGNRHRFHLDPGIKRVTQPNIQNDKFIQHFRMCIFNSDDKCPYLQFCD